MGSEPEISTAWLIGCRGNVAASNPFFREVSDQLNVILKRPGKKLLDILGIREAK